jgi:translocation and assembly module TamA
LNRPRLLLFYGVALACVAALEASGQDLAPDLIPDSEFNADLPSLEPNLGANLGPGLAVNLPSLEPILPDLGSEPDLKADFGPLPPLAEFKIDPQALVASGDSAAAKTIEYQTRLEGFDAHKDLAKGFIDLSALMSGEKSAQKAQGQKAQGIGQIRARARSDEALAQKLLASEGYYDAFANIDITPPSPTSSQAQVTLRLEAGKVYRLGQIKIEAAPTVPSDLILKALDLAPNAVLAATTIEMAEARVIIALPRQAYAFAKVLPRSIVLDEATLTGDYTLAVDVGPRGRFGGFRVEGINGKPAVFDTRHLGVLARFERGDLFDSTQLDDLRAALTRTGLLASIEVEAIDTKIDFPDATRRIDIKVAMSPAKPRTLSAEVGYNSGEGYLAAFTYTQKNRFPPQGALIYAATLGSQTQALTLSFIRSNAQRRDRSVSASVDARRDVFEAFESSGLKLSYAVARTSTPLWQKLWTYSYGLEVLTSRETDFVDAVRRAVSNNYVLISVPLKLGYDKTTSLLDPEGGFRAGVALSPQISLVNSQASNLKLIADYSTYRRLTANATLAFRARLGSLYGGSLDTIAPSQRLYAGGGGSVRGFSYQALGPKDLAGDPTGGRSLNEASLELRYKIGPYGIVPFIDAGQVYASDVPRLNDWRIGLGIGARLYTAIGPVRIDIATPLSRQTGEASAAVYVGIGQSF